MIFPPLSNWIAREFSPLLSCPSIRESLSIIERRGGKMIPAPQLRLIVVSWVVWVSGL